LITGSSRNTAGGFWTMAAPGSLRWGRWEKGQLLAYDEKLEMLRTCVKAVGGRGPVVAAVSALSTSEAVALASAATDLGCDGLMVLPPYVYKGDWREMKAHVAAVFNATPLACMLYNNPVAYGTDFLPEQILNWRRSTRIWRR
jgi:1-pyrroline-4-hydroxy-2-carboxylate deaminase